MPPPIVLSICLLFIGYLFWMELKKKDGPSHALWIPLIWMFLAGSRYVSQWLNLSPSQVEAYHEGSPLDAVVFALLIMGGVFVLSRRKIDWNRLISQNKWIWLYFLYCGISLAWSDYPLVSFKRWIKELGNLIMVIIILTDRSPYEVFGVIMKRLAILWLPLSIVFFKYYPALGRQYHPSTGEQFATGVGTQKNSLGMLCLICGIYFSWKYIMKHKEKLKWNWQENVTDFFLMGLIVWLLQTSKSATSLACLLVAVVLFLMSRTKAMTSKPNNIIALLMTVIPIFFILETTLDLSNLVLELLGRSSTLTGRVPLWEFLAGMAENPIVGSGYQSFWLGERLEKIWGTIGQTLNQAHNGYLEQYLNLGFVGVAFIGIIILSGFLKIRRQLQEDYPSAVLCLCLVLVALLYNYTEASFYGINNMWLLLLFAVIEKPSSQKSTGVIRNGQKQ